MVKPVRCFVHGVGISPFKKPGATLAQGYPTMAAQAGKTALKHAGIKFSQIDAAVVSYCYGDSTSGQAVMAKLGLTGIPIFNVNNNCSSGSTALMLSRSLIQSGRYHCVMALGFEQMDGGLSERYPEKISPWSEHIRHMDKLGADPNLVRPDLNKPTSDVVKMFAYAAREYFDRYPTVSRDVLTQIAYKNRMHGLYNENACFYNRRTSLAEIATKPMLCDPINIGMSAPTADGAAAAILVSESFLRKNGTNTQIPVEIIAQEMCTDTPDSFGDSYLDLVGYSMARTAANRCYATTKLRPDQVDIVELHDCFSCNELFLYEALGFARPGEACHLLRQAQWQNSASSTRAPSTLSSSTISTKAIDHSPPSGKHLAIRPNGTQKPIVINPSGGLESKGHPIGATAQKPIVINPSGGLESKEHPIVLELEIS